VLSFPHGEALGREEARWEEEVRRGAPQPWEGENMGCGGWPRALPEEYPELDPFEIPVDQAELEQRNFGRQAAPAQYSGMLGGDPIFTMPGMEPEGQQPSGSAFMNNIFLTDAGLVANNGHAQY
jgi:hypothetical protein